MFLVSGGVFVCPIGPLKVGRNTVSASKFVFDKHGDGSVHSPFRFSSGIFTHSDGSLPLQGSGDTPPETFSYIYRGSGHTFVIQWATENSIPTLKYKQRTSKSTLQNACLQ